MPLDRSKSCAGILDVAILHCGDTEVPCSALRLRIDFYSEGEAQRGEVVLVLAVRCRAREVERLRRLLVAQMVIFQHRFQPPFGIAWKKVCQSRRHFLSVPTHA